MESKFQVIAPHPAGQEMHEYMHLTCCSQKFLITSYCRVQFSISTVDLRSLSIKEKTKPKHKPTLRLNSACYKGGNRSVLPGKQWYS